MRYEHDCDECIPLGEYEEYDLYYCPLQPTLVARYGPDGDYTSGMHFKTIKPLNKARELAIDRGLIKGA